MAMAVPVPEEAAATKAAALGREGLVAIIGHSDILEVMLAKIGSPLTREEVEFISATYGRVLSRMDEEKEQHSGKSSLEVYREVLEKDMDTICGDVLHIFQHHLLPSCSGEENVALYTKMLSCINWILTLLTKDEDKELHIETTLAAYEAATKLAVEKLSAAHPLQLTLHLTKMAFYTDVIKCPEWAIALARQALRDARPELALLDEESSKKSADIMGLMEEKLKLWELTSPNSKDYSEAPSENNISSMLASVSLEEEPSYSGGSPSPPPPPVVPLSAGPPVAPDEFISPGDWGYEVHDGHMLREIWFRKKAAR